MEFAVEFGFVFATVVVVVVALVVTKPFVSFKLEVRTADSKPLRA
jgi:hypothetical protein